MIPVDDHRVGDRQVHVDGRRRPRTGAVARGPGHGQGAAQTRDQVIARYRADLWRRLRAGEIALEELAEIAGCWYACWCLPRRCHGEVLARAAAWAAGVLAERDARQAGESPS